MEQSDVTDAYFNSGENLTLTSTTIGFLEQIRKWTRFLAIVGFVMTGLMVVIAFSFGTIMNMFSPSGAMGNIAGMGSTVITIIYLIVAVIQFFPVYYLYRFSANLDRALTNNDQQHLESAMSFLKSHYKFVGILVIIVLAFYALGLLVGMLGAVM